MHRSPKTRKTLQSHAKTSLSNRYNLVYTQHMHDTLLNKIHSNDFRLVLRQSNRVTIFDVYYKLQKNDVVKTDSYEAGEVVALRVVYDSHRKGIVTFLDLEMNPMDAPSKILQEENFYE